MGEFRLSLVSTKFQISPRVLAMPHNLLMRFPEIHNFDPKQRLHFATKLFWWSLILTPPALGITWFFPRIGMIILQFVSFGAITLTAYDILATSDVRNEQDNDKPS